jgi:predicted molibdopterin-dependent oxidoreductase YjgC
LRASPRRLVTATLRARGAPASPLPVERALEEVAGRLRAIRERHGADSIGILGSARTTVEECRLLVRLARALGTPHLDSFQRLGYVPLSTVGLDALEEAPRILVLAANLTVRQAQVGRRVLRAISRGAAVRFIHSRRVQLASLGAEHLHPLPGRELEALGPPSDDEVVVAGTELAVAGQGGRLLGALRGRRALLLADYVNQRGMVEAGVHPVEGGLSAWEMLESAAAGELRALLVFADDPFEFFPALAGEAFARTELTVAADAVRTSATRRADVSLPGALLAEKDGHVVSFEGRVQEVAALSDPPGGWSEGRLLARLLELVGERDDPAVRVAEPAGEASAPLEPPSAEWPFVAALDTTSFWSTHALTAATVSAWREARGSFADFGPGYVTLNPDDARALGVPFGGGVRITSPDGAVSLAARLNPRTLPGTVQVPMVAWERVGAKLGALAFDPALRIPVFRPRAVRLGRA